MKLDIEGAELRALRGAEESLAKHRPTLLVEINLEHFPLRLNRRGIPESAWL